MGLMFTAACGGDETPKGDEKITLTIAGFGDFGFKPPYEEYKQTHKNIEIQERSRITPLTTKA